MKLLAALIMRGRVQAIVVTAASAIVSLLLPALAPVSIAAVYLGGAASYISGAAVGLVTLRAGLRQGFNVMAGATLAVALLGQGVLGNAWIAAAYLIALWLPVWVASERLRVTVDLPRALHWVLGYGALLVVGAYAVLGDPAGWWMQLAEQVLVGRPDAPPLATDTLASVARLMTGMAAAGLTVGVIGALLLARWWQAALYNPGGFREEFHGLRLGRKAAYVTVVLLLIAVASSSVVSRLGAELAVVAITVFVIQGLAVTHGLVAGKKAGRGWLVAVYALLLIMPPPTAVTLAVAGLADNWFDFRGQFRRSEKS